MPVERFQFTGSDGSQLAASLDTPEGERLFVATELVQAMAAREVPLMSRVQRFAVQNTWRYSAMVSFIYCVNSGSNWPSSCTDMARSTRGCTLMGPGPINNRAG